MAERQFLADIYTPSFLMGLCGGLTDFQAYDAVQPFIGQWMRISGTLTHATPNPAFEAAGVTIVFSDDGERRDAFLWFDRDLDRLAKVGVGEEIAAEGQIKSISSHTMVLENCGLPGPHILAIAKAAESAERFKKAVDSLVAEQAQPEPEAAEPGRTRNISTAEMRRFAQLYLQIWGDAAKEIPAWQAMKACYPNGIIGRDPFLKQFREFRGPGKRGNPSIRGQ